MGIMASVKKELSDTKSNETINAIFDCFNVQNKAQYDVLIEKFKTETETVQKNGKIEIETRRFLKDRVFIHDRYSLIIFRITDTDGRPVYDFDLLLTAGDDSDPNHLPEGFFIDRQRNTLNKNMITYFFNYDVMVGTDAAVDKDGNGLREKLDGATKLGFKLKLRPDSGFVQYIPCEINATAEILKMALHPNATTLIDICVQRVVDQEVFRLVKLEGNVMPTEEEGDFKDVEVSRKIVE